MSTAYRQTVQKRIESACARGLENDVFPGCAVGVSFRVENDVIRVVSGYGNTMTGDCGKPVTPSTYFDLASLTKPLCTVPCISKLVGMGEVDWQSTLDSLDVFKNRLNKGDYQIRHLLAHCSGLPSYKPYFKDFKPCFNSRGKDQLLEKIYKETPIYPPGTKNLYSDLDYILLGDLVEKISGKGLDEFYRTEITNKLDLDSNLLFFPLWKKSDIEKSDVAATENCPWRNRVLQGEVHDEHSWLMGGVAGHAGLFGTVEGVLNLCECMLQTWLGKRSGNVLSEKSFAQLFHKTGGDRTWYMGFDTPTAGKSSSGRYFSPRSAGHLGFSGTSFWMDPEQEIIVVLLTNRVHPSRENLKIREFRPYFHDLIMEIITGK